MFRSRSWFGGGWGRPKNLHSLEHLKYLYNVMARNQTVSEHNRGLLVESLRSIAEILIWGDQNDSSVFDFFLEKNMLSFFLRIMRQRSGGSSYVCVQLLQTLNILFENIRNETSLYYLLSNNHVNSIIVHKFDFSDEEVMAYYISFLKTLSLKLNAHTIHFFYNEHTNDFPLYTEAIKFFNHPESMVRIAVRTLTLNVYRVEDTSMLAFIRARTAAPYFSNLVWFIGKHVLELDACVRNDADHQSQNRLSDLVAEHLDHLHYLNDILCLNITDLNQVLTEHLLHKLLIPLYIYSLININSSALLKNIHTFSDVNQESAVSSSENSIMENLSNMIRRSPYHQRIYSDPAHDQQIINPRISCVVSLFLLSQVFLILTHAPLVHSLAWIILNADTSVFKYGASKILESYVDKQYSSPEKESDKDDLKTDSDIETDSNGVEFEENKFIDENNEMLSSHLVTSVKTFDSVIPNVSEIHQTEVNKENLISETNISEAQCSLESKSSSLVCTNEICDENLTINKEIVFRSENQNITDEEKELLATSPKSDVTFVDNCTLPEDIQSISVSGEKEDCLIQVVAVERIVNKPFLETVLQALDVSENDYSALFALCLLFALANNRGVSPELLAPVFGVRGGGTALCERLLRLVTAACVPASRVRLVTLALALRMLVRLAPAMTQAQHEILAVAREHATAQLRNFYKSDEIFLDMFEHEYFDMSKGPLNVEWLCMDAAILLPPTGTPMTGIEFTKRLPCGEVERARRAIRVFFLIRDLSMTLNGETETQLPLTNSQKCVQVNNVLDLNNSDLIACTVIMKDGTKLRRFLVIDTIQLILVEPDTKKLGWGITKLVGFLQDIEVVGDKDDSRCLHITIQRPLSTSSSNKVPLLSAKFIFDDHIRCMAAKQRLTKGRIKARQKKMQQIAGLLGIPGTSGPTAISSGLLGNQAAGIAAGLNALSRVIGRGYRDNHRALVTRPGFATPRRESLPGSVYRMSSASNSEDIPGPSSGIVSRGVPATNGVIRQRENISPSAKITVKGGQQHVVRSRDNSNSRIRSREGSPRMPRPRSEEIPLELIKKSTVAPPSEKNSVLHHQQTSIISNEHDSESVNITVAELSDIQKKCEVKNRNSKETSFIAQQNQIDSNSKKAVNIPLPNAKRKGAIETV